MEIKKLSELIVEFYERLSSWEESVVKDSGLTTAQMHTIEIVGHAESIKMKDLAEKTGVTTGTLTVSVDKLEKKGLLQRKPHERDRRSYMIVLTKEGEKYFREHNLFHIKMTEDLVSGLSEKEQDNFTQIMKKIIGRI